MNKAAEAIALKLEGLSYREVGRRLGVSPQRAQQLVRPPAAIVEFVCARASSKCQDCGIIISGHQGHVHHLAYAGVGNEQFNDIDNLVYLCISCHRRRHVQYKPFTPLPPVPPVTATAIRTMRRALGESVETFGARVGATGRTVENWEQGRNHPDALARRVLAALDLRVARRQARRRTP